MRFCDSSRVCWEVDIRDDRKSNFRRICHSLGYQKYAGIIIILKMEIEYPKASGLNLNIILFYFNATIPPFSLIF
jgi:hypothetical protein